MNIMPLHETPEAARKFNFWGRVPGIGSLFGIARAIYGLVMAIFNTVMCVKCYLCGERLGVLFGRAALVALKTVAIGLIQTIPIIGNIASCCLLRSRPRRLMYFPD
jgi:hypothetical protein